MSDTTVSLLTAPGTGAIATIEVRGPRAYSLAKHLFKPAGKSLPEAPDVNRFYFGTLGADEVVLAVAATDAIEVHCHGGRRVVRWVIEQFTSHACVEATRTLRSPGEGFELLQRAPTLRTASILLDQLNGAFANEVRRILALIKTDPRGATFSLHRFAELGNTVGRHLVEPWKVVVAGSPNVGKSSLVNALAGYQRAVISEVTGTTRDAVGVRVAFDGWPVELIDTAGIREAEGLEAEGIERSRGEMAGADLVLWVLDATASEWVWPLGGSPVPLHTVVNKCDAPSRWAGACGMPLVSARTGVGVPELAAQLVARLVPSVSASGAVPFTPQLTNLIGSASAALVEYRSEDATALLREALGASE